MSLGLAGAEIGRSENAGRQDAGETYSRMTNETEAYRETLRQLADREPFLLAESGLPGPRGNFELANVAADEGDESTFRRMLAYDPQRAPANSPQEFLAFCGVVGLGKLLAEGKTQVLKDIRNRASDPRWRVCEAVAMALQRWGRRDMPALLREMVGWSKGGRLEQRPPRMERWIGSKDRDVQWVMKQNLRKNRLTRLDPKWVKRAQKRLKD